jgi:two-component system, cell cycle response regulator DivK
MNAKILLIEDNEANRYLAAYLLQQAGHEVVVAPSANEAFATLERYHPDLILLDIQLPDLDGYEIARRLKSHPRLAAIPLVAITSFAMPGDRQKAERSGCAGYIEKPINHETFAAQIAEFLPQKELP